MKRATFALAFSLMAGAAAAQCPTTLADASAGVYVDFDGYIVRYDRRADGTVEEVEFDTQDGGTGYRYLSHHGIFILESAEMVFGVVQPDTNEVITYDVPLPNQIAANMTYSSMTNVRYGSDAPFQEPLEITVGAQGTEQIGGCTMATLPVEMRTGPSTDQYISNFTYFPALGFGIFVGGGGQGETQDVYRATYIGTVPPSAAATAPAPGAPTPPASPGK